MKQNIIHVIGFKPRRYTIPVYPPPVYIRASSRQKASSEIIKASKEE